MSANRRRRGRAGRVVVGVAAVAAVGAAAAAGFGLPDRGGNATAAQSQAPQKTAKVAKQTLVDTQTESGSLGHGSTRTIGGKSGGTVTALVDTGSTVQRGQTLYRVDNTPVVLLYGALPSYRALRDGDEGPDVKQLEENLSALGYSGFTVDEKYSASTATAVRRWQGDLGLTKTGTVEVGRVVYAAGPIRIDSQEVEVGDPAGGTLLKYTSTAPVVTVELEVADQRLAKTGNAVTVKLPGSKTVPGKITMVETIIHPAENNKPAETRYQVTISPDDAKAFEGLDQLSVDVGFTAGKKDNVLAVPVQALLALAEGGYGVQVVDGGTTRIVAVQIGLFAAGKVEVSGEGISEGTLVGMPS